MTRPRRTTTSQAHSLKIALAALFVLVTIALGMLLSYALAHATTTTVTVSGQVLAAPPDSLNTVIDNLRNVIVGLLVALATLFLTVAGVRYILAGGDPGEVEAAKKGLRYAGLGYGVAALAPLLVTILKGIVGAE
ncbi:pilin [Nonomuraea sp. NPDC050540]|uniref:pilin n=1 Tax=Nonomuraea TaxID=83681 RepID=UPI00378E093F